ncbi:hypothetical protein B0H11DRAFT_1991543, partial [Mycena galericulata]
LSPHNGREHAIAWTLGDVWELEGTGNEEGSSSLDKRFLRQTSFPAYLVPIDLESLPRMYSQGLCFTVSVVQFLLASYLSPFFRTTRQPYPCEDDALAKENILPSPEIRAALPFAGLIGLGLILLMGSCLRSAPRACKGAGFHVALLSWGSLFTFLFILIVATDGHYSNLFWSFASSCANTAFMGSGKCAAVGLHMLLPFVDLVALPGTAWIVYRRAYATNPGWHMVKLPAPPPKFVAAWTIASVKDLGIGGPIASNDNEEDAKTVV